MANLVRSNECTSTFVDGPQSSDSLLDGPYTQYEDDDQPRWYDGKVTKILSKFSSLRERPGILWAILVPISQAGQMILLAKLGGTFSHMETLFVRSVSLLFLVLFISWERDEFYNRVELAANFLYGLFDTVAIILSIVALGLTSASDTTAILFNIPLPATVLACMLLGERFDIFDGALLLINSVGLFLISKGSLSRNDDDTKMESNILGLLLSFGGLLLAASMPITVRFLAHRSNEDPYLISFNAGCVGTIMSVASLYFNDSWKLPETTQDALLCVLLQLLAVINFVSYGKALMTENTLLVTTVLTLCIPLVYVYDILFNDVIVIWATLLGMSFTIGSSLCLTLKTMFTSKNDST